MGPCRPIQRTRKYNVWNNTALDLHMPMTTPTPPGWEASKRRGPINSRATKRSRKTNAEEYTFKAIQNEISSRINTASDTFDCRIALQLDDLVSRHTFAQSLEKPMTSTAESVVEVTKVYEEQYMRECLPGETPCVMGDACECSFIDRTQPFVGTCFVIPHVRHADNNMCVLCLRKTSQILFYRIVIQGLHTNTTIQRHGNICGRDNEYHPSAMLVCPPSGPVHCMPLPIVAHQRNRYSITTHHGIKYVKQHGVGMQDFHTPPPPISV